MSATLSNGIELKGQQSQSFFKQLAEQDTKRIAHQAANATTKDAPLKLRYYKMRNGKVVDEIYGE
ncbi:MAG: hypothetical protein WC365_08760 [Candidatus Babeliales bacterium]|jgi:hypothetical protein